MRFELDDLSIEVPISALIIAGWTGRDPAAVQHHIDELKSIGVEPPSQVPLYYRVSRDLLVQTEEIQVLGKATSGEVEPLIVRYQGQVFLGLASDQTDRELETVSVAASKQACAKPVSSVLWRFEEMSTHLDQLRLECDIKEDGSWIRYQVGTLGSILPLATLIKGAELRDGQAMLCGTLGAIGGVRPASSYKMMLLDPVLGRSIELAYSVEPLPVVA